MEKDDKGSTLIRMGVSGWKFLLVPAYPGCPGSKAVKRSCVLIYLYVCCYHGTHTHLTAPFPGLPRWAGTRKVEPIWILLKQETVSGCGISWARCKSAPHSRQITMPAPHSSVFYRPDALPATQPTASKHWRHTVIMAVIIKMANWSLRKMSFQFSNSLNSIFSFSLCGYNTTSKMQ